MNKTIVTITNKDYLIGTYVMFYSLLKNGNINNFTFHVMTDGDVDLLGLKGTLYNISSKLKKEVEVNISLLDFDVKGNTLEFYKNALAKFNVFKLDYEELVFLDSDLLILGDISELFNIEADFAACKDMGTTSEFNTGVMHIKKSWLKEEFYHWLLSSAEKRFSYRGDQEHVNDLVKNNYEVISPYYNTLKDQHRHLGSWIHNVKILHYISKKPWQPYNPNLHKSGNLEYLGIEKLWFEYFHELNLKNYYLFKDRTELIKYVADQYPKGYGVEVGVQEGKFSKTILENWDCETLFLIDPWEEFEEYKNDLGAVSQEQHEHNLNKTVANTFGYDDKVEIIRDYSVNAAKEFHDESLDFVYLDARHDKKGIKEDIEAWWPKVAKGGILAGHDYANYNNPNNLIEVKEVVDDFCPEVNCTLDGPFPSWWIKKLNKA